MDPHPAPPRVRLCRAATAHRRGQRPARGDPVTALPLVGMVAKQSDSMPAMVGVLTGALNGADALPRRWREKMDRVRGHCLPHLTGTSLTAIADDLADASGGDPRH